LRQGWRWVWPLVTAAVPTTAASTAGAATSKSSAGCRSKSADNTPILPATEAGSYEEKTATMSSLKSYVPRSLPNSSGKGKGEPGVEDVWS